MIMYYTITYSLDGIRGEGIMLALTQASADATVATLVEEYGAVIHSVELPIIPEKVR